MPQFDNHHNCWHNAASICVRSIVPSLMDGFPYQQNPSQGTFRHYFDVPGSGGHLGSSYIFITVTSGHHVTIFYVYGQHHGWNNFRFCHVENPIAFLSYCCTVA